MGYGDYSLQAHIAVTQARHGKSQEEVFTQGHCHPKMDPKGVKLRECRDSAANPASVGVVFALDVSGSMGAVPHALATRTMPTFMEHVTALAPDAQVMFMAVGNAFTDRSPLQVGQFEAEAAAIDGWLSSMHIEGAGGGLGESYDLAMLFGARHTAMDCVEKRGKKGYFFMTGDEPPFAHVNADLVTKVLGDALPAPMDIYAVTEELQKRFFVFFLIPDQERGERHGVAAIWDNLLHERSVVLDHPDDTAAACALLVGITEGVLPDAAAIDRHIREKMHLQGAEAERLARAVAPYAAAFARGAIAAPTRMGERKDPGFQG
jgi:hypothetical protein